MALTCTQKLQTWHHPNTGKRDNAKMASHIHLKYFRNAHSARKNAMHKPTKKKVQMLHGEDSNLYKSDWLSRDVSEISSKVEDGLHGTSGDISNHFLKTLTNYTIQAGLFYHLSYQNAYSCRPIHHEHNYTKQSVTYDDPILAPPFADKTEDVRHSALVPANGHATVNEPNTYSGSHSNESVLSEEKTKELINLISHSTEKFKTVKIPKCETVKLWGNSNYIDVIQGLKEWLVSHVGIITASITGNVWT